MAVSASGLGAELESDVLERFLRYVQVDTQAVYGSETYPSSLKQLDLIRQLADELRELGIEDVEVTEHGYVFATLPPVDADGAPTVGLIAHVDTSPDAPGAGVRPQVWRDYDGGDLRLPGNPNQVLSPETSALLAEREGHDIVTSDGTTLLGADDKAGVAEIMSAVAYLVAHPDLARPRVRIAFTVDEEVGHGTDHFDLERFGADFAYTLDGSKVGEIENETFSAIGMTVVFRGRGVHPGTAKGKLVNSIKLAAAFLSSLPKDRLSPETTEGKEGFVHPGRIEGGGETTTVHLIVRDHEWELLQGHVALVDRLAREAVDGVEGASVDVTQEVQYRNMRDTLEHHPRIVEAAEEAARRVGLEPTRGSIRGGTDGSRLTEMGLPTPNVYTGGNEYHSLREWISVQDMAISAATVVELVRVWAEPGWRAG
jgi:tripeptide aminopeptidase